MIDKRSFEVVTGNEALGRWRRVATRDTLSQAKAAAEGWMPNPAHTRKFAVVQVRQGGKVIHEIRGTA